MASLSHPMRNPNLPVLRMALPGKFLEPLGPSGFLGSPGKLLEPSGVSLLGFSCDPPGSAGEPPGGLPGTSWEPPAASWELVGISGASFGASWECLEGLLGASWNCHGPPKASWDLMGPSPWLPRQHRFRMSLPASWCNLRCDITYVERAGGNVSFPNNSFRGGLDPFPITHL
jgi:hypothetical protein